MHKLEELINKDQQHDINNDACVCKASTCTHICPHTGVNIRMQTCMNAHAYAAQRDRHEDGRKKRQESSH